MTSLTTLLLLPLSLLAIYHSTTSTAEARSAASDADHEVVALHKRSVPGPSYMNLANLLRRRRSFGGGLQAPPTYPVYEDVNHGLRKREEEWIWMPAHGYIPMPKDESSSQTDDRDNGIPNLLRYG